MGLSRRESRQMVNDLLQNLRILNQDGIDLYYDHFSNDTDWKKTEQAMRKCLRNV